MNNIERRRFVKAHVTDVAVAKTAINASRRQRSEAAHRLRKALAAKRSEATPPATFETPFRAA